MDVNMQITLLTLIKQINNFVFAALKNTFWRKKIEKIAWELHCIYTEILV